MEDYELMRKVIEEYTNDAGTINGAWHEEYRHRLRERALERRVEQIHAAARKADREWWSEDSYQHLMWVL